MLKLAVLPLNLIALVYFTGFFTGDLSIKQDIPDRIDKMSACTVNLTIDKKEVQGFAKLQRLFPEGVNVEPVELHGATFTFAQQKMKIIWMSLPEEDQFTVSYKLSIENPDIVEVPVGGTFSYLEDNKRMTYEIPKHILKVGPSDEEIKEMQKPEAYVYREIESSGDNRYTVRVNILTKYVTGFAKLEEIVPYDAKAEETEGRESVFSQVDNKVKFVWMSLPEADTFEVVYHLNLSGAVSKNIEDLSGTFSYLYDNETRKAEVMNSPPGEGDLTAYEETDDGDKDGSDRDEEPEEPDEPEQSDDDEPETEPEIAEKVKPEPDMKEETDTAPPEEEAGKTAGETDEKEDKKDAPATRPTDPDHGVNYRVQILAGHNSVEAPYLEKKYNFTRPFYVENHEGWIKYTTGEYGIYKDARDGRENLISGYDFPGPFVVAYNDGLRITVQEALMVTSQKWIK